MDDQREPDSPPVRERRRYYSPVQKDSATFLKTCEETGGELTMIEIEVAAGGGNAPHYHKTYDERFEVLDGTLEVQLGTEKHTLHPGQRAVAPRNTLHRFENTTAEPTTFLVELRPGSSGFEKALKAGYGLVSDGLTRADGAPKNLYQLAVLLQWSEIRMRGAMGLLEPLFRILAKRARDKGVDKELEAKYCS